MMHLSRFLVFLWSTASGKFFFYIVCTSVSFCRRESVAGPLDAVSCVIRFHYSPTCLPSPSSLVRILFLQGRPGNLTFVCAYFWLFSRTLLLGESHACSFIQRYAVKSRPGHQVSLSLHGFIRSPDMIEE